MLLGRRRTLVSGAGDHIPPKQELASNIVGECPASLSCLAATIPGGQSGRYYLDNFINNTIFRPAVPPPIMATFLEALTMDDIAIVTVYGSVRKPYSLRILALLIFTAHDGA